MSRSTCIPFLCIQQQTSHKLATILSPIQETCRRRQVDTTCIRQHVSWCKRGISQRDAGVTVNQDNKERRRDGQLRGMSQVFEDLQ